MYARDMEQDIKKEAWREAVARGEKIDPVRHGIGCKGHRSAPKARINGKEVYKRIFIRLRDPESIMTFKPIKDGDDFARRAARIEQ